MKIRDFTAEERSEIHYMMQRTWDYIGPDMLEAVAFDKGKSREQITMPRSHVIEVVLDANYIEMDAATEPEQKELMKKFRQLSYDDQKKIARKTFTDSRYGY